MGGFIVNGAPRARRDPACCSPTFPMNVAATVSEPSTTANWTSQSHLELRFDRFGYACNVRLGY
jgi:hypothetical protein